MKFDEIEIGQAVKAKLESDWGNERKIYGFITTKSQTLMHDHEYIKIKWFDPKRNIGEKWFKKKYYPYDPEWKNIKLVN